MELTSGYVVVRCFLAYARRTGWAFVQIGTDQRERARILSDVLAPSATRLTGLAAEDLRPFNSRAGWVAHSADRRVEVGIRALLETLGRHRRVG